MPKQIISKIPKNVQALMPNPRNPRTITDERLAMLEKSMRQFGDLSGIVYNTKTGRLVGGHQRTKKIQGAEDVVITQRLEKKTEQGTIAYGFIEYEGEKFAVRIVEWDQKTEKAANIAANKHGGKWDLSILSEDLLDLDHLNFDLELTGFTKQDMENLFAPTSDGVTTTVAEHERTIGASDGSPIDYSKKVKSPIYEPNGEKPDFSEMYDTTKAHQLTEEIKKADLSADERTFLLYAAERHVVFNYEKIAEFYAHASPEVQNLMERSALVIIDFNKAIENGFVVLSKEIAEAHQNENKES